MNSLNEVLSLVKEQFGPKNTEYELCANMMLIKVRGVDNNSLAKWITKKFDYCKVYVKKEKDHKIQNLGWIKIEHSDKVQSELVLTNVGYIFN
jgi:hypothetical protein